MNEETKDKLMDLADEIGDTPRRRTFYKSIIGELFVLGSQVGKCSDCVGPGPATVTKPPTRKKVSKKPTEKGVE